MREHVVNIQLRISARDNISRADLMRDLRQQLTAIQEQPPFRHSDGAQWWTNSPSALGALNYENVGEQLAYEAEARAEDRMHADVAAEMAASRRPGDPCPNCGGVGSPHVNACDPDYA